MQKNSITKKYQNLVNQINNNSISIDKLIKSKMHLRVSLDIDISYEEASFIKEKFLGDYEIRELTLIAEKKDVEINTDIDIQAFESVDTIVSNQLVSIESDTYSAKTLLAIYNSL